MSGPSPKSLKAGKIRNLLQPACRRDFGADAEITTSMHADTSKPSSTWPMEVVLVMGKPGFDNPGVVLLSDSEITQLTQAGAEDMAVRRYNHWAKAFVFSRAIRMVR